jgi:hypothetical protein
VAAYFNFAEEEAAQFVGIEFENLLRYTYLEKLNQPEQLEANLAGLRSGGVRPS